jgi:hypothetical protein
LTSKLLTRRRAAVCLIPRGRAGHRPSRGGIEPALGVDQEGTAVGDPHAGCEALQHREAVPEPGAEGDLAALVDARLGVDASLDDQIVRVKSPRFSYVLPNEDNTFQFFGLDVRARSNRRLPTDTGCTSWLCLQANTNTTSMAPSRWPASH